MRHAVVLDRMIAGGCEQGAARFRIADEDRLTLHTSPKILSEIRKVFTKTYFQ